MTEIIPIDEIDSSLPRTNTERVRNIFDLMMSINENKLGMGGDVIPEGVGRLMKERFPWIDTAKYDVQILGDMTTSSVHLDRLTRQLIPGIITDFYGARASGKSQICFQLAVNAARDGKISVFVDCSGNFRPERIVEMASLQKLDPTQIMDRIFVIRCLSIAEQTHLIERIYEFLSENHVSLILIDDLTDNFVASSDTTAMAVRSLLVIHLHQLSHLALDSKIPVVVTNTIRTRFDKGLSTNVETLESIVERGTHMRIQLERDDNIWYASNSSGQRIRFLISAKGVQD